MTNMKFFGLSICLLISIPIFSARAPEWVTSPPRNSLYYWGIGMCELSSSNYQDVAKRAALEEIVQQISILIESNSFLSVQETNLNVTEDYQQQLKTNSQVYLEDLQIFDSYQDKKNYYVCYRLEKEEYKTRCRDKSSKVAKSAFEYLQQARAAEAEGSLVVAANLYQKGLEIIEPWLFLDLTYSSENVPISLYSGFLSVFDGLTIVLQPQSVSVKNLNQSNVEIVASLSKKGTPIRDIPLKAQFTKGSGSITSATKTNNVGDGHFYLTSVNSKETQQKVLITIDNHFFVNLPKVYPCQSLQQQMPQALLLINVEQQKKLFYIHDVNQTIPPFIRQVTSVLTQSYFDVTTNKDEATYIIDVSTNLRKNGVVNGDLENLDEWLASFYITIKDKAGATLIAYSEEGIRVLVSEGASQATASQQASREMIKRFKRGFQKQIENLNL